jgi:hypothetical protein
MGLQFNLLNEACVCVCVCVCARACVRACAGAHTLDACEGWGGDRRV